MFPRVARFKAQPMVLHSGRTCFTEVSLVTETPRCNWEQEVHLALKRAKGGGTEGRLDFREAAAAVERCKHHPAQPPSFDTEEHTENSTIVSQMFHFLL